MTGFLVVNPWSGDGGAEELAAAARRAGIEARILGAGDDVEEIARSSPADEPLGVAGGDGSMGVVAGVAIDRGQPFVCVPFGTRNHFARDLGLDPNDPPAALDAFAGEAERKIDVGRVGRRVFVNNVSLGLYARLVHRREQHRRRRDAFARARALIILATHRDPPRLLVDGEPIEARVVVVANNRYSIRLLTLGERDRLDEGSLYLYAPTGVLSPQWVERSAPELTIEEESGRVRAAIDGEPAVLETPITLRSEPRSLRVLLPKTLDSGF